MDVHQCSVCKNYPASKFCLDRWWCQFCYYLRRSN